MILKLTDDCDDTEFDVSETRFCNSSIVVDRNSGEIFLEDVLSWLLLVLLLLILPLQRLSSEEELFDIVDGDRLRKRCCCCCCFPVMIISFHYYSYLTKQNSFLYFMALKEERRELGVVRSLKVNQRKRLLVMGLIALLEPFFWFLLTTILFG